jgi:hypothetical protein
MTETRAHRRVHTAEVTIDLSDFTDDEILAEAVFRNLIPAQLATGEKRLDARAETVNISNHIMCKRLGRAEGDLRKLIGFFVPDSLVAALDALRAGDFNTAVCELDRFIEPAASATAATLPKPFALQPE